MRRVFKRNKLPFLLSILWTVGILVVFAPMAVRRYRAIDR